MSGLHKKHVFESELHNVTTLTNIYLHRKTIVSL